MTQTFSLRIVALMAITALTMAAAAVFAPPAVADDHEPSNDIRLWINLEGYDYDDVNRPWDEFVLEIFHTDTGNLIAESLPGGDENYFESTNGAECFSEYFLDDNEFYLECLGLPDDSYTVGARGANGFEIALTGGGCDVFAPLPGEDVLNEPFHGDGTVVLSDGASAECQLVIDREKEGSFLYLGLGTTAPYSYTLDLGNNPVAHIYNSTGTVDIKIDDFDESYFDLSTDAFPYAICAGNESDVVGWQSICVDIPAGNYTIEVETPEGQIKGDLQCLSFSDFFFGMDEEPPSFVTGNSVGLDWETFTMCVAYLGQGVPIYVDVVLEDGTDPSALDDVVVEAYDSNGALVATAQDPSLETCEAVDGSDFPNQNVVYGTSVEDSANCAVLWVKPPHNFTSTEYEIVSSETYTIGISGVELDSFTAQVTDLPWHTDGYIDPLGDLFGDVFDGGINPQEPLEGVDAALTVDYEDGVFSSGSHVELTLVLAEEDVSVVDEIDDEEILAESGLGSQTTALGMLSALLISLGFGAFLMARRREALR